MLLSTSSLLGQSQPDSDSLVQLAIDSFQARMEQIEAKRTSDSIKRIELEERLTSLRVADAMQRKQLQQQLDSLNNVDRERIKLQKKKIDSMRLLVKGHPVTGLLNDTLFYVYNRSGALTAQERAEHISEVINQVYEDDTITDSITVVAFEDGYDVTAGDLVIASITDHDALWYDTTDIALARNTADIISKNIKDAKREYSFGRQLLKAGYVLATVVITILVIWLLRRIFSYLTKKLRSSKNRLLHDRKYHGYTYLTQHQQVMTVAWLLRVVRVMLMIFTLYISLPLVFSFFPFTKGWSEQLFAWIWSPIKSIALSVWQYLPNIFTIAVILFVMYHANRIIKYFFKEIQFEKLHFPGFFPDWAMPTYGIIRVLLIAFCVVLIFPYLPGSDSDIFKGVTVFVGLLFSFGSSSAIANMVAGLVITYMRPFKKGDRVQVAGVTGDVLERTLLVTRLRTPKNEEVTIPNSSILNNNTVNYTTLAEKEGLIMHTAVTIGYDVPWRAMHEALIEAASRTDNLLSDPRPFVLQTSLDDFYVSYQLNVYTREANKQAGIYSSLHQHIQDVCAERNIEIMSPHYRANRDGGASTIPPSTTPGN